MKKRIVEIDDDLDERVQDVKAELLDNFKEYFAATNWGKENTDISDFDTYYQAQGCDAVHDFADSSTPIYYSDIDGLYYLYGSELDEAYRNAGIGDGKEENYRQVAIYCYLSEQGFDYLRELEEAFNDWLADAETDEGNGKMPWDYLS